MDEHKRNRRRHSQRTIQEEKEKKPEPSIETPRECRVNINNPIRRWDFQHSKVSMKNGKLGFKSEENEEPEVHTEDSFDYGIIFNAVEVKDNQEQTKKVLERRLDKKLFSKPFTDSRSNNVDEDKTHGSILVENNRRFRSWQFSLDGSEYGVYNVVLGISVHQMNNVESITITITDCGTSFGPSETIAGNELMALVKHSKGITKWKLHQQLRKNRGKDEKTVVIETRTLTDASLVNVQALYSIEFMELHPAQVESDQDETSLVVHQPFIRTLDIIHRNRQLAEVENGSDGNSQSNSQSRLAQVPQVDVNTAMPPSKITGYSISGDGMYIATLAISETFDYDGTNKRLLFLDLWNLNSEFTKRQRTERSHRSPSSAQSFAGCSRFLPELRDGVPDNKFGVSLS